MNKLNDTNLSETKKILRRRIAFTSLIILILFLSYLTITFKNKESKQQEDIQLYKKKVEYLINAAVEKESIIAAEKYDPNKIIIIVSEPGSGNIISSCYGEVDSNKQIIFSKTPLRQIKKFRFEAGALVHPITLSIALENNIIGINDSVDCFEYVSEHRRIIDEKSYAKLTPSEIIKFSSNIGIAKISEKMAKLILKKEYAKFGLPYKHRDKCEFINTWSLYSNPLEILQAYSILANKGQLVDLTDNSKSSLQVISKKTSEQIGKALQCVVNSGTGQRARIDNIITAGKTATIPRLHIGAYKPSHLSLFIGYAPADKPGYLTFIILDNPKNGPYYAGLTAAPVFKRLMEQLTKIPD